MYQLPHDLDRPGQAEALEWILDSDKRYLILRAPTGFGKSSLAAACSIDYNTMALVLHKSLQSANYRDQYDFDILYGKSSYPCHKYRDKQEKQISFLEFTAPQLTAYDCNNAATDCNCPYQQAQARCMGSRRVSLNYAKFLMSRFFAEVYKPQYLFLDEGHNLPNIVIEFVGFSIDWDNEFIQCNGQLKPNEPQRLYYQQAMTIFRQISRAIERNEPGDTPTDEDSKEYINLWRKWKRLSQKVDITNNYFSQGNLEDWYYEATEKELIIKPLTAKYNFKSLFNVADKVILMSATITPNIAERLGLENDEWDYRSIPSPWPAPSRLVYDLGGPAMNYKSSEADKQEQARLIASVLSPDLTGIIHVASKKQAWELKERLPYHADYDYFIPQEGGTDKMLQAWYDYRQAGVYCISWAFHEGVDLGGDDINIIAKVPYPSIGSNYERARLEYDQQWYLEKTAYTLEQMAGRTRRGKPEHYKPGAKSIYLADSAWHRVKSLLSDDFRVSIRKQT